MTELQQAEERIENAKKELRNAYRDMDTILDNLDFPRAASLYWYLRNHGDKWEVCSANFGPGSKLCQKRRAAGNCYRTEEEAQKVAEIRNTLTAKMEGWV